MTNKKTISVVTSAFNEVECIDELANRLSRLFVLEDQYQWEVVLVDNGSSDSTWSKMQEIRSRDSRFKILRLSRNFRMDGGLTAGLKFARGDAVVLMAADLQDPPELISEFLRKWEEGFENIYMIVNERQGISAVRRLNSKLFYKIAALLTGNRFPQNASDFRLVDKKVYLEVRKLEERNRFVRGLFGWVGFRSVGITANRPPRFAGSSGAHTLKVIDLAFKGIFAHSYIPLKLITISGLALSLIAFISIPALLVLWVLIGVPFAGFGTLVSVFLLAFGLLALMLGLIAEYVGLIYEEVKQRPNFIVAEAQGLTEND